MNEQAKRLIAPGVIGAALLLVLVWSAMGKMEGFWVSPRALGMWFAAFLTLSVMSFLYDDNPFYRFAESLFIGVSAAYWMVQAVWQTVIPNLLGKIAPAVLPALMPLEEAPEVAVAERIFYIVVLVMGILLLWRLSPKGAWVSRWPLAVIVGWAAGTNLIKYLESDFTKQVSPALIPLVVVKDGSIDWLGTLSALVSVFGLLAALIYFFFSVEHKGVMGKTSKAGIWILMVTFGAAFGYTVMGRIALLVGRMEFLFVDWLKLIAA
jgi:hypothetical protein